MTDVTGTHEANYWKRSFFTIWAGQTFSLLGSSLAGFALVWWLTTTTGSAIILAGSTLMIILPQFLLSPLAGALVDRSSRRKVMMVADSIIALFSLMLALLFIAGTVQFWHIYVVMLIRSVGNAFHTPAMQASTPLMVQEKHLTRVAGINQTFQGAINIAAPPLAAFLLTLLPIQALLFIDVITALLAVLPLVVIAIPNPAPTGQGAPSLVEDIRGGFRFVCSWPGLMLIMVMASALNFLNVPAMSFVPLLVTQHFHLGARELAWIEAAFGLGIVAGGLLLGMWGGFKRRMITLLIAVTLGGVGTLLQGIAPRGLFPAALAGNLLFSFASTTASGLIFATVQAVVPPQIQGRVFSLLLTAAAAAPWLGLIIAGPVADALGVRFWFLLAGSLTILAGIAGFWVPALTRFEDWRAGEATENLLPSRNRSLAD